MSQCGVLARDEWRRTPKPRFWISSAAERQSFGRVRSIGWKSPVNDHETVLIRAAKMQHLIAIHVRRWVADRDLATDDRCTLPAVAESLDTLNYDGLMRVLRGDVQMTLIHAVDLSRHLGVDLLMLNQDVVSTH